MKFTRRSFLAKTSAALAALPLRSLAASSDVQPGRPNVLFLAVDDLRPLLNCYGVPWIRSPNIDRLAAHGTLFASNYCQYALCAPSRASLLTGLRPDTTGVYWNPSSVGPKTEQPRVKNILRAHLPDVVTLPQYFTNRGYVSRAMGKIFDGRTVDDGHDSVSWSRPYIRDFDFAPYVRTYTPPILTGYQDPETLKRLRAALARSGGIPMPGPADECYDIGDNAYLDGAIARTAVKEIEDLAKQDRPFFFAVGFAKPHLAFIAPKKYWDLYDRPRLPLAAFQAWPQGGPAQAQVLPVAGGELRGYEGIPKTGPISEAQQRELINGYAACISYIDAQVGLLLQALEDNGVAGNTIVCFMADHGWHLGEHGHWGKSTNYEAGTRVPLIIHAPGVAEGVRAVSLTESLDVYPTLCELCGLPPPPGVHGRSLTPVMRDPHRPIHEAAISQISTVDTRMGGQLHDGQLDEEGPLDSKMGWALRTPRYRYVEWRAALITGKKQIFGARPVASEFYDYEKDPIERENLAGRPEYAGELRAHQALFDRLLPDLPRRTG